MHLKFFVFVKSFLVISLTTTFGSVLFSLLLKQPKSPFYRRKHVSSYQSSENHSRNFNFTRKGQRNISSWFYQFLTAINGKTKKGFRIWMHRSWVEIVQCTNAVRFFFSSANHTYSIVENDNIIIHSFYRLNHLKHFLISSLFLFSDGSAKISRILNCL